MPVSAAIKDIFGDRIEPVDLIHGLDLLEDDTFETLLRLASSGHIGAALAAPYCCKHSRTTLRPHGPAPVRTPKFLDGLPSNTTQQQLAVQESAIIHDRSRILLSAVDRQAGLIILENPTSSMTWDDQLMYEWVHSVAPFAAQACACQFDRNWAKAWMFVANRPEIDYVARSCPHPEGTHEPIVGVRLPDGTFKSRLTAEYPQQLAQALAYIIRPYLTTGHQTLRVSEWQAILPKQLTWSQPPGRIEDGGGLPSSALQVAPPGPDKLATLRAKWFQRLSDSKQCLKITAALRSGCKEQPLSPEELKPYIADMLVALDCPPGDLMLDIAPGQPFRLQLWHRLATFLQDPDADFLLQLSSGVRLGVNEPLSPSPAWPQHTATISDDVPLQDCLDSWKSAQDHPDIVQTLIQEELEAGFIAHVPGGVPALKQMYSRTAIGKLGVVFAAGRSPRLVVDSSISMVTANTVLPNHMLLPRISDVLQCSPEAMSEQQLTQLTLDVAKAHRRILVHPDDGGLLCFHANGELYRCITLNFGARASGWYWGRLAGLMVRSCHALLAHGHALWQYVDDLLAWLDKASSPLWASLIVIPMLILGVPMSWHKAALSDTVDWIGWRISVSSWTLEIPPEKLATLIAQIKTIQSANKLTLRELQSLVGRLLWLTSGWRHLRPLLIPLYKALHRIPITMVGMDHITFQDLVAHVDDHLQLRTHLTYKHQTLRKGVTLCRVANSNVATLAEVQSLHVRSRRVWVGLSDPSNPNRKLDEEAVEAINTWSQLLTSTPFSLSMCPPQWIQVQATADAMASQSMAGLGGAAFFPDGSSTWFQFRISLTDAQALWPWIGDDMQKHIAAWELLAQFALSYCIEAHLPRTRGPIACHQATDNSAADAASAKGLTMTKSLAAVLTPYFKFMRRYQVYPHISHIPGRLNELADELSRFKDSPLTHLDPNSQRSIPWRSLLQSSGIEITQHGRKWPSTFDIHLREKGLLQSADWVLPSIMFWGVLAPAGRWSIVIGAVGTPHLYWLNPTYPGIWVVE